MLGHNHCECSCCKRTLTYMCRLALKDHESRAAADAAFPNDNQLLVNFKQNKTTTQLRYCATKKCSPSLPLASGSRDNLNFSNLCQEYFWVTYRTSF